MVITMAKLRMAHASTHGARKPPGPKISDLAVQKALINVKLDYVAIDEAQVRNKIN